MYFLDFLSTIEPEGTLLKLSTVVFFPYNSAALLRGGLIAPVSEHELWVGHSLWNGPIRIKERLDQAALGKTFAIAKPT